MKKNLKNLALLFSAALILSSCIGSFQLTNKVKDWNDNVGGKFANEVVFLAFHVIPVYEVCMFVDAVVLNSVEFWTGNRLVADAGERQMIKNSFGKDVEIKTLKNGYLFSDGNSSIKVIYDADQKTWKAEIDNQSTDLIKFVDDNNAQLFMADGEVLDVTLDEQGVEMARAHIAKSISMGK
ncbi:MAG: DUF3332 domain-containing protein [Bacteroidales bacterium]|nr:DUF3332 domain-containing protein [Bacteroidales bacterium]